MTTRPTPQTYADWQTAFDHFNTKLWGGKLPDCIITLRNHANSFGYFSKQRFINGEGKMMNYSSQVAERLDGVSQGANPASVSS